MRWFTYFILAYVAVAVQIGLGPYIRYGGAAPNFVLLAAVYIAMNAPREPALLGCFCMGLMQDLIGQHPLGLYALSYGLVGMLVVAAQHVVYRGHPLTHFSLGLVAALLTAIIVLINGWLRPPGPAVAGVDGGGDALLAPVRVSVGTEFTRVLYTALLAPVVIGILQRLRRAFAFQAARRKIGRSSDDRR